MKIQNYFYKFKEFSRTEEFFQEYSKPVQTMCLPRLIYMLSKNQPQ